MFWRCWSNADLAILLSHQPHTGGPARSGDGPRCTTLPRAPGAPAWRLRGCRNQHGISRGLREEWLSCGTAQDDPVLRPRGHPYGMALYLRTTPPIKNKVVRTDFQ